MKVPVQITLRDDLPHSAGVETHIKEKTLNLDHYCDNIISCHVVLELANKNHLTGNLFNTRITVTVPGKELNSNRNDHENMFTSIKLAFDDMTRQLEEYNKQGKGRVKNHDPIISGTVARLMNDGFGFIESADGTEYYFNESHLINGNYGKLAVGTPVHFTEFTGKEGLQARKIKVIEL